MKHFKVLIICLTILQSARTDAAVSQIGETVHFQRIGGGIIAVPLMINGRGPYEFVLDTGTDSSIIDVRLAQELGLNAVDRLTLLTATGEKTVSRTFAQTASVGGAVGRDMELLATNLDFAFRDSGVRGVLGQNFLQAFDLLLEYKKGMVTFLSPGAAIPVGGAHVPISLEHGRPALLWKIADERELRLLLDSGSTSLTFFTTDIPNFRRCMFQECRETVTSSVSAASALSGMLSSAVIGDASLHDVRAMYMTQPAKDDKIDGMLPTALFNSVYINNHEHFAILNGAAPLN
jgi:predicted aspartyl protease